MTTMLLFWVQKVEIELPSIEIARFFLVVAVRKTSIPGGQKLLLTSLKALMILV
ncbi:hypothetical protein D3C71_1897660 [compost metagenome]